MSAPKLPRLLAAYRKYGSCEDLAPVRANNTCSVGAVPARTTNGAPIIASKVLSSHGTGFAAGSGDGTPAIERFKLSAAIASSAGWRKIEKRPERVRFARCAYK